MIESFTITNYLNDSIILDLRKPEQSGFLVKSVTGLGPVKAEINTTDVATYDGAIFNSAHATSRNIVFNLAFIETEQGETIEDIRQKSYKFFPIKKSVEVVIKTDNKELKTTGYVESNEPDIFSKQEGTQISIICPDSYYYLSGKNNKTKTAFSGIEPSFEFPFSNESLADPLLVFGDLQHKTENLVKYYGESEVGITIHAYALGEITNLKIYNLKTRESMTIDSGKIETLMGTGIISGDEIVINTQKGQKTVRLIRDGSSTNIINCLDKYADWFTLTKGDNLFGFTAEKGVTNVQFLIENEVIYEGV